MSAATKESIEAIIVKIDTTISLLLLGTDDENPNPYAAVDIKEADHQSSPSILLQRLTQMRKMYQELLENEEARENAYIQTLSDTDYLNQLVF